MTKVHTTDDSGRAENPLTSFLLGEAAANMADSRYTQVLMLLTKAFLNDPASPHTFVPLAGICRLMQRLDDLERFCRMRLRHCPDDAEAWYHLAGADFARNRIMAGIASLQATVTRNPRYIDAWIDLGCFWKKLREIERAIECFQRAVALDSTSIIAHDNLLFTMLFSDRYTPDELFEAHTSWAAHDGITAVPYTHESSPTDRLRVGYLSPDFREHSVASFIEPVLAGHDRTQFEIICYHSHPDQDDVTARLRARVDGWRDISGVGDNEACDLIRADGIHILVDLAGHTAWNRLALLAMRPAPVQVTWLGYPHSTGLTAIDYRISDAMTDPPGMSERWHTEQLIRLPATFLCYQPPEAPYPTVAPPCYKNGFVTLASFNNFAKVSPTILECWREILTRIPDARLLLKSEVFSDPEACRWVVERLAIPEERLLFMGKTADRNAHLALYGQVDVALDTFPYNGTTTTCEALYMGVPVVSLAGQGHASRVGASLLNAVGIGELLAETRDDYVNTVVDLATDVTRLVQLRQNLRQKMAASPLMDQHRFVTALETEYRLMWQRRTDGGTTHVR